MSSLLLMAALSAGTNAPEQVYYYYPYSCYAYPCYSYCWYPAWPGGPIIVVQQADSKKDKAKDDKKQNEKKQDDKSEGKKDVEKKDGEKKDPEKKDLKLGNQALLLVELPADAQLFVDGKQMKSGQGRAAIITPALDPSKTYAYQVRVELVRGGQTLNETQSVVLRPGHRSRASFAGLETRAEVLADR
ncbi:MAG: TIGR03000 domain-containing protein [Planctomycetes bacterium]|nr:TIGR03000 domain-containing protein [Planctomycetota bacterium]